MYKYPIAKPEFGQEEIDNLTHCIKTGWVSSQGEFVERVEDVLSQDDSYALTTSSGTSALHLAMIALGIGPGDEVIIPAYTFVAPANMALLCGAKVVLCDVYEMDYNISINSCMSKMTSKTKAVVAVHMYGNPCEVESLRRICDERGVYLIEDAAQAIGGTCGTGNAVVPSGYYGDIGIFSFFGNKTATCGEGGAVITKNKTWYTRMKALRDHGRVGNDGYNHTMLGFNYRMTNLQAAVLLPQLDRVAETVRKKRKIRGYYAQNLVDYQDIIKPQFAYVDSSTCWMSAFTVKGSSYRLIYRLTYDNCGDPLPCPARISIEVKPGFKSLADMPHIGGEQQPLASSLAMDVICLPSYTTLTEEDVTVITDRIKELIKHGK